MEKIIQHYLILPLGENKEKKEDEPKKIKRVEDDEYLSVTGERNYYLIAHTIKEEVKDQASIMVNGKLKEYQIKVRTWTAAR